MTITTTWTSAASLSAGTYDWNNLSNWTAGIPDGTQDLVEFAPTFAGAYTIVNSTQNASNIQIDDPNVTFLEGAFSVLGADRSIVINAGTISLQDGSVIAGALGRGDGTITLGGNAVIEGNGIALDGAGLYSFSSAGTAMTSIIFNGGTVIAKVGSVSILEVGGTVQAGSAAPNFQIAGNAGLAFDNTVDSSTVVTFTGGSAATGILIDDQAMAPGNGVPNPTPGALILNVAQMDVGTVGGPTLDRIEIAGDNGATAIWNGSTLEVTRSDAFVDKFVFGAGYSAALDGIVTSHDGTNSFFSFDAICFASGTRLRTTDGDRAVETLTAGDLVAVEQGGQLSFQPVKWIGYRTLDLTKHPRPQFTAPIRIARGAFGENLPVRDLSVSPDHCLFLDGKLIPAKLLVNGMTIRQDLELRSITYYHIEMERHSVLLAEGVAAESYLDTGNRAFFSNAGLALMLHPEFHVNNGLRCWATDACAPLAVSPAAVLPVWRPLADRAVALGYTKPTHATTTDADIHLVADGRRIETIAVERGRHSFIVPAGVKSLALASRSVVPSVLVQYLDDPRQIGVAVRGITIRGMADRVEFSADHPALDRGWHAPERADGAMWRWTTGHGVLPVGIVAGPIVVDVIVSETTTYLIDESRAEGRLAA